MPERGQAKRKFQNGRGAGRRREDDKELLHYPLRLITQAAKKAKQFEVQKLARKLKQMGEDGKDSGDLPAVLEALRAVTHGAIASHALYGHLRSDAAADLRASERLQGELSQAPADSKIDPTSAEGKAQNRILASKHVRTAIEEAMSALRGKLAIKGKAPKEAKGKAKAEEKPKASKTAPAPVVASGSTSYESESEEADLDMTNGIDEERPDGFFSGSEVDDSVDESRSDRSASPLPPPPSKKRKVEVKGSTFLPSLSVGYTLGESDVSDGEAVEELEPVKKGKNRPGQRERQAKWESMYGQQANHLSRGGSGRGRGAPRGRGEATARGRGRGRGGSAVATQAPAPAKSISQPAPTETKKPSKEVHPSWAAAAAKKAAIAEVKPQGKKITFA